MSDNNTTCFNVTDEVYILPPDTVTVTVVGAEDNVFLVLNENKVFVVQS